MNEATTGLRAREKFPRERRWEDLSRKLRRLPVSWSALWAVAFYAALATSTALWRRWDQVGLPRLTMGTGLLVAVLLATDREVIWAQPMWGQPVTRVVAASFRHPPTLIAIVLALVFIATMLWFG